uniref:Uncharacterized protein n=1 Tax=Romanomermis culicivorax TaxID=13658 RepID=A0A915K9Q6_ROMCU
MKILLYVAVIYILRGCGRIVGSTALGAFLCAVAVVEFVLAVSVGKRRIYWAAVVLNFAGDNQLEVCGSDSGPVITPCYGDCQNCD